MLCRVPRTRVAPAVCCFFRVTHTHLHLQAPLLLCSKHCTCLSPKRIQMSFSQDDAFIFSCPLLSTPGVPSFCAQVMVVITDTAFGGEDGDGERRMFVFQKTNFLFILQIPWGPHRHVCALNAFSIWHTLPLSALWLDVVWIRGVFYLFGGWSEKTREKTCSLYFIF